jgi:autoinducer 2-degrading protein
VIVVHVQVHVVPEQVEAFRDATLPTPARACRSRGRPVRRAAAVGRPHRFVLVEVYRTAEAPALHKETAHYLRWRDAVASMMASPRTSVRFANVFPDDAGGDVRSSSPPRRGWCSGRGRGAARSCGRGLGSRALS